ncbi:Fic family protein [Candidatus Peregrinibacteria bacterium]|nr:Fic family protein [Candidatus Peregrinibacteria bacterium]
MKYLVKKVIKGKAYYYLQYEEASEYLGSFLPQDLKERFLNFFKQIARSKAQGISRKRDELFPYGQARKIEKAHYQYLGLKHPLFEKEWHDFQTRFAILFTYNSNRAEGSKVTRPEIEKFALSNIRKPKTRTDREIFNSFQALGYALSEGMKWNVKSVKKIHALLLNELEPLIAGKWKTENNVALSHQKTADFKQVAKAMKNLIEWLKKGFRSKEYPPFLALVFYTRFEAIHPFLDGNGRVGRILLNALLHKFNYCPVIFFTRNHQEHCAAIQQAREGRNAKLHKHFSEQLEKTLKEMDKIGLFLS